jgi:hypothetical protein
LRKGEKVLKFAFGYNSLKSRGVDKKKRIKCEIFDNTPGKKVDVENG